MTSFNNPNDPNRGRVTETSGTDMRTGDVRRTDVDDRGGSFWPWIIGLLVLLAVGWIVIEAFDGDDDNAADNAVPAGARVDDNQTGTQMRDGVIRDDANRIPDATNDAARNAGDAARDAGQEAGEAGRNAGDAMKDAANNTGEAIKDAGQNTKEAVKDAAD